MNVQELEEEVVCLRAALVKVVDRLHALEKKIL